LEPTPVTIMRSRYTHPNTEFEQPGTLYRKVMNDLDRAHLVNNIVNHLKNARRGIQERQVKLFYRADPEYGTRVAKGLGLESNFLSRL